MLPKDCRSVTHVRSRWELINHREGSRFDTTKLRPLHNFGSKVISVAQDADGEFLCYYIVRFGELWIWSQRDEYNSDKSYHPLEDVISNIRISIKTWICR